MNLEEEEKQLVGIDHAGQDCDLSGHCQDFFQCDSSIQNKICSQSRTRHLISMNIDIDMLVKYSYNLADYVNVINAMSDYLFFLTTHFAICYFFIAIHHFSLQFVICCRGKFRITKSKHPYLCSLEFGDARVCNINGLVGADLLF